MNKAYDFQLVVNRNNRNFNQVDNSYGIILTAFNGFHMFETVTLTLLPTKHQCNFHQLLGNVAHFCNIPLHSHNILPARQRDEK